MPPLLRTYGEPRTSIGLVWLELGVISTEGHSVNLFTSRPWPRLITVLWDLTSDQLRAPTPTQPLRCTTGLISMKVTSNTNRINWSEKNKQIVVNYSHISNRVFIFYHNSHSIFWSYNRKVVFYLYLKTFWNLPVFLIPLACFRRRSSSSLRGLYFISDMSCVPHFQRRRARLP